MLVATCDALRRYAQARLGATDDQRKARLGQDLDADPISPPSRWASSR